MGVSNKKKIGVLTLPFNNNYGGLLQSYALQTFIKKNGYEVELIRLKLNSESAVKPSLFKYIKQLIKSILFVKTTERYLSRNMRTFADETMHMTELTLAKGIDSSRYEAVVVGSDQVWRKEYTKKEYKRYFFDFIESGKVMKIAYAASFGKDTWDFGSDETDQIKELISKFKRISVRESSGVALCHNYLGIEALQVLDPVFLLYKADYKDLILEKDAKQNYELVSYILDFDDVRMDLITKFSDALSYNVSSAGILNERGEKRQQYPSVSNWLSMFSNAKFIVTDSFHGCAFAILLNKPFVVYGNESRGLARMKDLLAVFSLQDRLILDFDYNITAIVDCNINWDRVNSIIAKRINQDSNVLAF